MNFVAWLRNAAVPASLLAVALTAFSATLPWKVVGPFGAEGAINAEWYLYLIGIQFVAMFAILAACGWPKSWLSRGVFLLANIELIAVAVLVSQFALNTALFHCAQVLIRISIASLWLFVVGGIPFVVRGLYQRWKSRDRGPFRLGKAWFACLIALLMAEPIAVFANRLEQFRNRLPFPSTLAAAPVDALHVVAVGESTMAGFPYNGRFGIPEVVSWQLRQMYPNRNFVVENLARDGLNLRKAIQTLDGLTTRPDLLLLYSGHNEFFYDLDELWYDVDFAWERFDDWLAWSPLFRLFDRQLLRGEALRELEGDYQRQLVDRKIASDKALAMRIERFRDQLEQLAAWCQREQIPTLWFIPAGSESDFEPNRSYLAHPPTPADRQELEATMKQGRRLEGESRFEAAADVYRKALSKFPDFAELEYRLAECLYQLKEFDAARKLYAAALEHDGQPIRMTSVYRQQVREAAKKFEIPTVDVADVLRPKTSHGILDRSVFVDYVHPNLRAYYALGLAAVDAIQKSDLPIGNGDGKGESPAQQSFAEAVNSVGLTAADLAKAYARVAEADETQRKLRYESSRLERDSRRFREWSEKLKEGQIQPGDAGTESLR